MYMLNFESDWLRQQTTRLGASPVRFTKIGQKKIGKNAAWSDESPFLL